MKGQGGMGMGWDGSFFQVFGLGASRVKVIPGENIPENLGASSSPQIQNASARNTRERRGAGLAGAEEEVTCRS
jgi:hypothetical protein